MPTWGNPFQNAMGGISARSSTGATVSRNKWGGQTVDYGAGDGPNTKVDPTLGQPKAPTTPVQPRTPTPTVPRTPTTTTPTTTTPVGGGGGTKVPDINQTFADINQKAQTAQDAALARAKEQAGLVARSSLEGLRSAVGERGMLGSGAEANATGEIASNAAGSINDVIAQGLKENSGLARELGQLSYQGALTSRGQDITSRGQDINKELGLRGYDVQERGQDITQRGQDIQADLADRNLLSSNYYNDQQNLLNALRALVY